MAGAPWADHGPAHGRLRPRTGRTYVPTAAASPGQELHALPAHPMHLRGDMPLKGTLTPGKQCRITIECAPTMPGTSAVAIVCIPKPNIATPAPLVTSIAPGARVTQTLSIPDAQMLLVDVDLPVDHVAVMTLTVEQDAATVATGLEDADTEWTFLVAP